VPSSIVRVFSAVVLLPVPPSITRDFLSLVQSRTGKHRTGLYTSIACLPLSAALSILPAPNVFIAWNLLRVFSHYRALQGCNNEANLTITPVPDAMLQSALDEARISAASSPNDDSVKSSPSGAGHGQPPQGSVAVATGSSEATAYLAYLERLQNQLELPGLVAFAARARRYL
jgi:hypothetical protein